MANDIRLFKSVVIFLSLPFNINLEPISFLTNFLSKAIGILSLTGIPSCLDNAPSLILKSPSPKSIVYIINNSIL